MGMSRKEIRDSVLKTSRQSASQIGSLVEEFINLTLSEINYPGWAFPRKNFNHLWSWLRRKTTFATVASTSDYVIGRDVDKIALLRQTDSPARLRQITDPDFYQLLPNPTATGNPLWYRQWEVDGVSTRLSTADTIDVVSSSNSDSGNTNLTISISGYDSNGIWRTETYQLNGKTTVTGSITFAAREIYISKQQDTTGSITVTENSGGTTLGVLGPKERSPKFKVVSLYPTPSSASTMYMEYYTFIPSLNNDSDVPIVPENYHYAIRLGALAKVYQYLGGDKKDDFITTQAMYSASIKSLVAADRSLPDLVTHLKSHRDVTPDIWQRRSEDAVTS